MRPGWDKAGENGYLRIRHQFAIVSRIRKQALKVSGVIHRFMQNTADLDLAVTHPKKNRVFSSKANPALWVQFWSKPPALWLQRDLLKRIPEHCDITVCLLRAPLARGVIVNVLQIAQRRG